MAHNPCPETESTANFHSTHLILADLHLGCWANAIKRVESSILGPGEHGTTALMVIYHIAIVLSLITPPQDWFS